MGEAIRPDTRTSEGQMAIMVSVKLTPAELALLHALNEEMAHDSVSETLREAILAAARARGVKPKLMKAVKLERTIVKPRRSAELSRLIGPKWLEASDDDD